MQKSFTRHDFVWVLSLFGTAVGAGILFLPINAGIGGMWPLLIIAVIAGPMVFFAHRGLCRFIMSSKHPGSSITQVVDEHFGATAGAFITVVYFLSIYPIVLIYAVGITNTVDSFIVNQLGWASPPRFALSGILISLLMFSILAGERIMLKVTQWLVYPLIIILLFLSLYMMPNWSGAFFTNSHFDFADVSIGVCLILPVIVFAFNHGPIISYFSQAMQREHGEQAPQKANQILMGTAACLWVFVMLFVFSCVLSLTPQDMALAKEQNISILSYLANHYESPFIRYFAPLIAFTAIASSFFGHYLGAIEGLQGIVEKTDRARRLNKKKTRWGITIFMFVTCWLAAIANPSILQLIDSLSGPIIAIILFIIPICAVYKVAALKRYRGQWSNIFVLIIGTLTVLAAVYDFIW